MDKFRESSPSAEETIRDAVRALKGVTLEAPCGKPGKAFEDERLNFAANLLRSLGRWRQNIEYLSRMQERSALKDSFGCEYSVYERRQNNWFELEEKKVKLSRAFEAAAAAYQKLDERDRTVLRQAFLVSGKSRAFKRSRGLSDVGFHKLCKSALRRYSEILQAPGE